MALPIYLDNHATTRTDPRVVEAMLPFFTETYGNAASAGHRYGWEADAAATVARERVAELIGAEPDEVVFTSGATEANNLAIKGTAWALRARGDHLITTTIEHRAVLDPMKRLAREGFRLTVLPCDEYGMVDPKAVAGAITDRTILVSVMAANNEVGTINPIAAIGAICRDRGIPFHTDATQAVGKVPLRAEGADLISLTAHKFHGPKGIGALIVRRGGKRLRLFPLLDGGGHERGLRSGTLPVPLAVGLGETCAIASREWQEEAARTARLRDTLRAGLSARIVGLRLNGHPEQRLPGNLHVSIPGVDGNALLMAQREVAVSSGSACTSAEAAPSHVLAAMGVPEPLIRASLRFGVGRFNTPEEIDFAVKAVADSVERLRATSDPEASD